MPSCRLEGDVGTNSKFTRVGTAQALQATVGFLFATGGLWCFQPVACPLLAPLLPCRAHIDIRVSFVLQDEDIGHLKIAGDSTLQEW